MMPDHARLSPILSILIHVPDWRAATDWYAVAFPGAELITALAIYTLALVARYFWAKRSKAEDPTDA